MVEIGTEKGTHFDSSQTMADTVYIYQVVQCYKDYHTKWFDGWNSALKEIEPKPDLLKLNVVRILQVEDDGVDAVGVADEVVVEHVVVVLTRKFPNAQISGWAQVTLK